MCCVKDGVQSKSTLGTKVNCKWQISGMYVIRMSLSEALLCIFKWIKWNPLFSSPPKATFGQPCPDLCMGISIMPVSCWPWSWSGTQPLPTAVPPVVTRLPSIQWAPLAWDAASSSCSWGKVSTSDINATRRTECKKWCVNERYWPHKLGGWAESAKAPTSLSHGPWSQYRAGLGGPLEGLFDQKLAFGPLKTAPRKFLLECDLETFCILSSETLNRCGIVESICKKCCNIHSLCQEAYPLFVRITVGDSESAFTSPSVLVNIQRYLHCLQSLCHSVCNLCALISDVSIFICRIRFTHIVRYTSVMANLTVLRICKLCARHLQRISFRCGKQLFQRSCGHLAFGFSTLPPA